MPPKDAIGTKYPEISDKALMLENLRSKCVFETTKVESQEDDDDLGFSITYIKCTMTAFLKIRS
jgi:hypothetical protein